VDGGSPGMTLPALPLGAYDDQVVSAGGVVAGAA
jgi:hypothetical protein